MQQETYFDQLSRATSSRRLEPYRHGNTFGDDTKIYGAYAWNVVLSESLYPAFHGIEIALRNSIHEAASQEFGDQYWFKSRLKPNEQGILTEVTDRLNSQKKPLQAGDFVAAFIFGFWVSLFNRRYEQVLWPRLLSPVFPSIPRRQRTRKDLFKRLDKIRILRNRVSHHEPIWHWKDLTEQHHEILETIGWISPAMLELTKLLDRFPDGYTNGRETYETRVETLIQNWSQTNSEPGV
jgi:hypothetical protein